MDKLLDKPGRDTGVAVNSRNDGKGFGVVGFSTNGAGEYAVKCRRADGGRHSCSFHNIKPKPKGE
jgi:hypothetical protein